MRHVTRLFDTRLRRTVRSAVVVDSFLAPAEQVPDWNSRPPTVRRTVIPGHSNVQAMEALARDYPTEFANLTAWMDWADKMLAHYRRTPP